MLGCASHSQKTNTIVRIEFLSMTRGYSENISIDKDSLIETKLERGSEQKNRKKVDPADWDRLTKSLSDVLVSEIPDLKSPTMKRAYDGARHSTITITTSDQVTVSHMFDDHEPHAKLDKLMDQINKIKVKYLEENN